MVGYSYQGPDFDGFFDATIPDGMPFALGDSIAGTIELTQELGMGLNDALIAVESFSFSTGQLDWSSSDPDYLSSEFRFTSDASGAITDWLVFLVAGRDLSLFTSPAGDRQRGLQFGGVALADHHLAFLSECVPTIGFGCGEITSDTAVNNSLAEPLAGVWTETPVGAVPVPAAIWLFGTALIGLVGFGKRKSKVAV